MYVQAYFDMTSLFADSFKRGQQKKNTQKKNKHKKQQKKEAKRCVWPSWQETYVWD